MARIVKDQSGEKKAVEAGELDQSKLKALNDPTRAKIMEILAEEESYPSEVAKQIGIDKQKAYYHFRKLEDAELIEQVRKENLSGGHATFYAPTEKAYYYDLGSGGEPVFIPDMPRGLSEFMEPLLEDGGFDGKIVVGSPDNHGPDQVRARDGHLAGEIGMKLGNYGRIEGLETVLDTDVFRDGDFDDSMVLVGGVLTNTVTKKFNSEFPAYFSGESFPYREITTPENTYSEENIGIVAKAPNPENSGKAVYLVAGVRNSGTLAAVLAFKNIESLTDDYRGGEFYRVVRGLDMDGDGKIDDFEVVE